MSDIPPPPEPGDPTPSTAATPPAPTATLPPTPIAPARKAGGLALAALIVGAGAFLFGLIPYFGILVALTAIVLAIIALVKKQSPTWMPLVGGAAAVIALLLD